MPKETITMRGGSLAIGWSKDGAVQLAGFREEAADAAAVDENTPWLTLDRAGCNRAIRALRRARDAAYGADA